MRTFYELENWSDIVSGRSSGASGNDYLSQRLCRTCGLLKTTVDCSSFNVRFAGFKLRGRRYCRIYEKLD